MDGILIDALSIKPLLRLRVERRKFVPILTNKEVDECVVRISARTGHGNVVLVVLQLDNVKVTFGTESPWL